MHYFAQLLVNWVEVKDHPYSSAVLGGVLMED